MTYIPPPRLVSDDEIRASYQRERELRQACGKLMHYIKGEMEPAVERILQSIRDTSKQTLNHLAVQVGLAAAQAVTSDPKELLTLELAAQELDRVLDLYDEGKGNFSQRHIAHSLEQDRDRAVKILKAAIASPAVEKFWQTHARQSADRPLGATGERILGKHVRNHFARSVRAEDYLFVHMDPEPRSR